MGMSEALMLVCALALVWLIIAVVVNKSRED